ncbi:MAG: hypothetical protein ACM3ZR_10825 [Pseudomonadota bacterium]
MKILLVISFLIPLIYIGYLVSQLDIFLSGKAETMANAHNSSGAVVLGSTKVAVQTVDLLDDMGIPVIHLLDPFQLIKEQKLCYMFALSENDADNIAFCKIGYKLYRIESMVSICNDKKNEYMFISENINYLPKDRISAAELVQLVLRKSEVDHER